MQPLERRILGLILGVGASNFKSSARGIGAVWGIMGVFRAVSVYSEFCFGALGCFGSVRGAAQFLKLPLPGVSVGKAESMRRIC